jgi:hypothetical protein
MKALRWAWPMDMPRQPGSVKDIQPHLRHAKADTTANEYMQELPESVGRMVESMYEELMDRKSCGFCRFATKCSPTRMGGLPLRV